MDLFTASKGELSKEIHKLTGEDYGKVFAGLDNLSYLTAIRQRVEYIHVIASAVLEVLEENENDLEVLIAWLAAWIPLEIVEKKVGKIDLKANAIHLMTREDYSSIVSALQDTNYVKNIIRLAEDKKRISKDIMDIFEGDKLFQLCDEWIDGIVYQLQANFSDITLHKSRMLSLITRNPYDNKERFDEGIWRAFWGQILSEGKFDTDESTQDAIVIIAALISNREKNRNFSPQEIIKTICLKLA